MSTLSLTTDEHLRQTLSNWLIDSETFKDRLETTPMGRKTARVGRAIREYHFNFYNLVYCGAGLSVLAAKNNWIPAAALGAAQAAQHAAPFVYLAAFSAFCLSNATSVAIRDTQSFTHELKQGAGLALASKAYARHLAAEAKASTPNPYAFASFSLGIASWTLEKLGLRKASTRLEAKTEALQPSREEFNAWRLGAATQARLMRHPEWRSLDAYRETARFLLACEYGHFRPHLDLPDLAPADDKSRAALAISFDKTFPSSYDHGCLSDKQKIRKLRSDRIDSNHAFSKLLADATQFGADPRYAPQPAFPSLAELIAFCDTARRSHEQAFHASTRPAPDLAERLAPWSAALEAQALAKAIRLPSQGPAELGSVEPTANAPRRATRL